MGEKIRALKWVLKEAVEILKRATSDALKDIMSRLSNISVPKISSANQLIIFGIIFLICGIGGTIGVAVVFGQSSFFLLPFIVGLALYTWFVCAGEKLRRHCI